MTLPRWIAFCGDHLVAEGGPRDVARQLKLAADAGSDRPILVFDAETSAPVELDLRGSVEDVLARLPAPSGESGAAGEPAAPDEAARRGPGRPRLGVVAREITLLPRHWDWLATQPGGASVAIRKLVEEARKTQGAKDRARRASEAAYRFAAAMAGNLPHYEDAMRALFAGDRHGFEAMTQGWPATVRDHARRLATPAFDPPSAAAAN
ncbi:MAG: DUF2239 family protein [Xanthobacteraceae bacterium]